MRGHSLLTRLRRPELAVARRSISDSEIRDAILLHLRQLCSTRLGTMVTCPDYGVIDVSELCRTFPDGVTLMCKTLRNSIATYEPRLTNVVVRHVPSAAGELVLRFEIVGQVKIDGRTLPMRFETAVDAGRRVSVA